jgi:hypothetical protein
VAQARGDHREAVALYDRAAAAGIGAAHTRLGDYYNFAIGPIRPDIDRAIAAYRAATDLGDLAGTTTLAFMHRLGRGVPRDPAEMIRLFRIAADQGYHFAQINLAQTYLTGEGVPGGADPALGIPDPRAAVPHLALPPRGRAISTPRARWPASMPRGGGRAAQSRPAPALDPASGRGRRSRPPSPPAPFCGTGHRHARRSARRRAGLYRGARNRRGRARRAPRRRGRAPARLGPPDRDRVPAASCKSAACIKARSTAWSAPARWAVPPAPWRIEGSV